MKTSCQLIDIESIKGTSVVSSPFPYMIAQKALHASSLLDIQKDYPVIEDAGSFPIASVTYGKKFEALLEELKGDEFRSVVEKKFDMDLSNKPVLVTVRGCADHKDGRIHTDSKSKLITVLLYMNEDWQPDGGRLRLLKNNQDLDDYVAEVPPEAGTMLLFKVTDNGWHGHKPFIGVRKVIQLNYIASESALDKHQIRHRISAKLKQWRRRLCKF